ncbi:peptidoglycan DD-metalloendopeptidase family protein [Frigidibacter sp. SD6-1]|uniref:murein hydrolase activator EnvC family protein n=1 Tax=Frigidibacter sp. SD6-1 TaxID=3032581 RepID=UPI0024DFEC7F|nr:peptidoglycan DD-metalloendopeptidase family protein [Frigidibacter sp. SD6-1]
MRLFAPVAVLALTATVASAQTAPATAESAAVELRAAIEDLQAAKSGKDRIAALTRTIRAYETGLSAFRDALRAVSVREAEIHAGFEARRDDIGRLLGVMAAMEREPAPVLLLHPSGPLGAARSAMVLSAVAPAVQAQAERLKADLTEMRNIRRLQEEAQAMLTRGLVAVQEARTALSKAMQDRTDLPQRYLDDPEELQQLLDSAGTLDAFAEGLRGLESDIGPPLEDFAGAKGALGLPVLGWLLRRAGEADAAGILRPGLLIATAPGALVTAPWPATIRYRGPLLDYGNVMILEPANGYLLILAGMGSVFGETGDVLTTGAPVGLMGGAESVSEEGSGANRTETLYIELRENGATVDPGPWFVETKDK